MEHLEFRGTINGLNSFFDHTYISKLLPDDELEVNGLNWLVTHVKFYGKDCMEIKLIKKA